MTLDLNLIAANIIRSTLLARTSIADYVADRIYFTVAPEEAIFPYCIIQYQAGGYEGNRVLDSYSLWRVTAITDKQEDSLVLSNEISKMFFQVPVHSAVTNIEVYDPIRPIMPIYEWGKNSNTAYYVSGNVISLYVLIHGE